MPTREELDAVRARIADLTAQRFLTQGEFLRPVAGDSPEAGTPWIELDFDDRRESIYVNIDWKGFDPEQQMGITDMVADGESATFWEAALGDRPLATPTREQVDGERSLRPLTQELIDCCQLDVWPGIATAMDFGLTSSSHLGALQFAIREGLATPQELDAAMGKGDKLTEIAQRGENPYRFVTFRTLWDDLGPEPEESPTPEEAKALAAEIRADEQAARVRDYGEADAATYEQRVADGAEVVQHLGSVMETVPAQELDRAVAELEQQWAKPEQRLKAILEVRTPAPETPTTQPDRERDR